MAGQMNPGKDPTEILVVDDSPTQADRLGYLLERHGFMVTVAHDGAQALAFLEGRKPSLVVSDIVMPGMDGYELCNRIKSDQATSDIPVILLTSLSDPEDVLNGIAAGADSFLTKPYKEEHLLSNIEQILANRKARKFERVRVGVEIMFGGKSRYITADQQQILTLLISTYEAAVHRNAELIKAQDELSSLNERLEDLVEERTASLRNEIADRKSAEKALMDSEGRLTEIAEQARIYFWEVDREGLYTYVSPSSTVVLGFSPEEVIGRKHFYDLHPAAGREAFKEAAFEIFRRKDPFRHFENAVQKKDGLTAWVSTSGNPVVGENGDLLGYRGSDVDITGRKLVEEEKQSLEKQVRTAQKMEAVGTLAGGIAHDFNNALTGIVGFGELLRIRIAGDGQASHDLDEILRCAERATTLTRQLLTFARRQVIEPVNLDLCVLIADLMRFVDKVVGEHIEVKTSLGKDVPTIRADRGQVEQVVMNLCLNSRDAMPEGGRLTVETGDVSLDEEYVRRNPYMKTGRYALLTVSDTGIGMDEKTCAQVFEPFFTTKGPDKGTGLGLAMVYGIVKQHGGFIHLYSEPGIGTTFKVYFPAVEARPDAVPARRTEEIVRGGTETILLAEDEEGIRSFIERALKELGYDVLAARNGEEALELFRRKKEIALAVLDVVMPRKGGKEAFEEMHRHNPRLKVILMSGYAASVVHGSSVLSRGVPFLSKPFGPTMLARKVREVLDAR